MAWMRLLAGRLKSDYRYSSIMVYNTFPWPAISDEQKNIIEVTAKQILSARRLYPDSSLADLYNELTMPVELRKTHQNNDKTVMDAYDMSVGTTTENDSTKKLFQLYKELIIKENKPQ